MPSLKAMASLPENIYGKNKEFFIGRAEGDEKSLLAHAKGIGGLHRGCSNLYNHSVGLYFWCRSGLHRSIRSDLSMSKDNGHKWYVVRCFSNHEKKVKEYLEREMEMQDLEHKVSEILIPTETIVEMRSGKKRTREKNFFPGYLLVKTTYDEEINNLVQGAPSTIGFLKSGKNDVRPKPLREAEANRILGRVEDSHDMMEKGGVVDIPYNEGDLVKVVDGPFKDFDGTIQEVNADKLKLRVLVSIFGRKTPVEVDVNQVEPAT
jgi:transcriptional antiterminator NusG